jgi:hypothetical protein
MTYYIIKVLISAIMIVLVSEIAKRSSLLGGIFASIPLISVLAMIWLYSDTKDIMQVSSLATSVFWLVIPSLALFVSLPVLLKNGMGFYLSMGVSIIITILSYYIMIYLLGKFGVNL